VGKNPIIIILAGPNGAGKSTSAPMLLRDTFAVDEFVNADTIAQGLSAFKPEAAALEAGRIMLSRLQELTPKRADLAFETTLASRTFAPWLRRLSETGYKSHLMFLTLPNADAAIARVASRVSIGGHNVPVEDIKRRFNAGLKNLFHLYMPIVSSWKIYDNAVLYDKFAKGYKNA
jgi:predicted ABC-type ATPase